MTWNSLWLELGGSSTGVYLGGMQSPVHLSREHSSRPVCWAHYPLPYIKLP